MKRSALAWIGSLTGLAYLIYLSFSLYWSQDPRVIALRVMDHSIGLSILLPATASMIPAAVLNWIGWLGRKRGAMLAAALLYCAAAPLPPEMFAVPLALALMALAATLRPAARSRKREKAGPAEDVSSGAAPEAEGIDEDEADLDDLDEPGELEPDGPESADFDDEPDLALDGDSGDDLQLDPALEDDEPEERESRPRADGVAVFLGLFMGAVAVVMIALVVYGLLSGKLLFMP